LLIVFVIISGPDSCRLSHPLRQLTGHVTRGSPWDPTSAAGEDARSRLYLAASGASPSPLATATATGTPRKWGQLCLRAGEGEAPKVSLCGRRTGPLPAQTPRARGEVAFDLLRWSDKR
jgi:hypothetical protein